MSKAYLVLSNGRVFEGQRFGADDCALPVVGELVFNTSVVGYIETLTDPAYCGQIIMQTFPLGGNYGWIPEDAGEHCFAKAFIVREWSDTPSNFRMQGTLDQYLKDNGVVGLCGIDTRELTQVIREEGVMPACIVSDPADAPADLAAYRITDAVKCVSDGKTESFSADAAKYNVTVINYGAMGGTVDALVSRGCNVTVVPFNTCAENILAADPDGIVLSGGPGDPADNADAIAVIKQLAGKKPLFGFGLGHQLLALAMGGSVEKLPYGHRGSNQPVKDIANNRVLITNQNHGYTVLSDSIKGVGEVIYTNVNDNTCEGIRYNDITALSVQFAPEGRYVPLSDNGPFDDFISLMGGNR